MPNLQYILRTSPCASNPLLSAFDNVLRRGLSKILNIDLNDSQWTQASLPVQMGGLGVRSACMLAPSAFLASAATTLSLQNAILPETLRDTEDTMVAFTLEIWKTLTPNAEPIDGIRHIQRAWDTPVAQSAYTHLQTRCDTPADTARLKAIAEPHAGDWLIAPPTTAIGLRMSDEAIRIAVGFRLGCITCKQHKCICGVMVNARGLHGLSCWKSGPRHTRHFQLNYLIWRAVKRAQIQGTNRSLSNRWKKAGWSYFNPLETWRASRMGCHRPRHICRISSCWDSIEHRSRSEHSSSKQNLEVQHTCNDTSFCSNLRRNRRTLEPWIIRIHRWTRQENFPNYTRFIGNNFFSKGCPYRCKGETN